MSKKFTAPWICFILWCWGSDVRVARDDVFFQMKSVLEPESSKSQGYPWQPWFIMKNHCLVLHNEQKKSTGYQLSGWRWVAPFSEEKARSIPCFSGWGTFLGSNFCTARFVKDYDLPIGTPSWNAWQIWDILYGNVAMANLLFICFIIAIQSSLHFFNANIQLILRIYHHTRSTYTYASTRLLEQTL